MTDIPLNPGGDAFPNHVYDALGGGMHLLEKRIGGRSSWRRSGQQAAPSR